MLKFRVWDNYRKCYTDSAHLRIHEDGYLSVHGGTKYHGASNERFVIERCTGFSDKNGRDIYEGDLIAYRHSDQPHRVFFGKEQGCFYAQYAESKISCMPLAMLYETEIIGTVHNNCSEKANCSGVEGV